MPIERRRKPSAARIAQRGFLRATGGQDAHRERPARRHGLPLCPSGLISCKPIYTARLQKPVGNLAGDQMVGGRRGR